MSENKQEMLVRRAELLLPRMLALRTCNLHKRNVISDWLKRCPELFAERDKSEHPKWERVLERCCDDADKFLLDQVAK